MPGVFTAFTASSLWVVFLAAKSFVMDSFRYYGLVSELSRCSKTKPLSFQSSFTLSLLPELIHLHLCLPHSLSPSLEACSLESFLCGLASSVGVPPPVHLVCPHSTQRSINYYPNHWRSQLFQCHELLGSRNLILLIPVPVPSLGDAQKYFFKKD